MEHVTWIAALPYRLLIATPIAGVIGWLVTGSWKLALWLALGDLVAKATAHTLYQRSRNRQRVPDERVPDERVPNGRVPGVYPSDATPSAAPVAAVTADAAAEAPAMLARVIWFTGLSGAGKTTIAKLVYKSLQERGIHAEWLDGDVTRAVLPQTGFTREERNAHVTKAGFIAKMLEQNGITVVASYISPYEEARDKVRAMCKNFVEVHVATPLAECERRDVKGLYAKARAGEITHFTGIDDPYETPASPEVRVNTVDRSPEACRDDVLTALGLKP